MRLVPMLMVAVASMTLWQAAATASPGEPPSSTATETSATAAPATQETAGAQPAPSSEPSASAETRPAETHAPAATSSPSTSATTDDGKVKLTAGDDEAAAQLKRFKAAGYKPEVHDGSVVFCRTEPKPGSRFERRVCTTAHLLELQMAQAQDTLLTAQRNGTIVPR